MTSWVLLMVAGVLLGIGSFTSTWFERDVGGVKTRVGLQQQTLCANGECLVASLEPAAAHQRTRRTGGRVAYGVGLAGALAAFVCATILVVRRTRHGAIVVLGLALAAAGAASAFIAGMDHELAHLGWSARVYLGGCALAFLGSVLALAKVPLTPWDAGRARR